MGREGKGKGMGKAKGHESVRTVKGRHRAHDEKVMRKDWKGQEVAREIKLERERKARREKGRNGKEKERKCFKGEGFVMRKWVG